MYPNCEEIKDYSLQSRLFGHRMKDNQSLYEYLIEFLQVMISPKEVVISSKPYNDYFPIDEDLAAAGLRFMPKSRIGLKRFVFFPKSKLEGKTMVDRVAYDDCVKMLRTRITADTGSDLLSDSSSATAIIQNLLYGFNAVNQNRSWFDQNLLPICEEVILPESMGLKSERKSMKYQIGSADVDGKFSYNRYTFMRRGGEIYYLHLLQSLNEYPHYKENIERRFDKLIHSFPQFSRLCNFIQNNWERHMAVAPSEMKKYEVKKNLGAIPDGFIKRGRYTLSELNNFLDSAIHPFEKIDVLANGIILQILRMMYVQAADTLGLSNCVWIMDMSSKSFDNKEIKKLAVRSFQVNEECINKVLYWGLDYHKEDLFRKNDDEHKIITDAAQDSYKLFRKLGKTIGIVIPNKGTNMRFTLSEKIIKFLVLSIVPPNGKVTLDSFIQSLYGHYGMIIDRAQYKLEMDRGNVEHISNLSFFDSNKEAFAQKLKDCGFLRDLSDSTAIVENPYDREV